MLWLVPTLCAVACLVSMWFAYKSEEVAAQALALCNGLIWAVANIAWQLSSMWLAPIIDLFAGVLALQMAWLLPSGWLKFYLALIASRLGLHVFGEFGGPDVFVPYLHALNATYAALLVAVAWPGREDGFRILLRGLRGVGGSLSPAAAWRVIRGR